jgi:2-amino-4-hydroxy-6-hydroxymethyldihydropteridine diphosphokinase
VTQVYLGLGSSINRQVNLRSGLDALAAEYGSLTLSSVYESEAVGFEGALFFNLVVGIQTQASVKQLSTRLKAIEDDNGRVRSGSRFSPRTLDIDILIYGAEVGEVDGVILPRPEITENAYVLWPLAEIAGSEVHPVLGVPYQQLWDDMPKVQAIRPIGFEWQGRNLTVNPADESAELIQQ